MKLRKLVSPEIILNPQYALICDLPASLLSLLLTFIIVCCFTLIFIQEKEPSKEEEEVDIDLNDPEVEKAAIKIQAGFKGFQTRKEMQSKV